MNDSTEPTVEQIKKQKLEADAQEFFTQFNSLTAIQKLQFITIIIVLAIIVGVIISLLFKYILWIIAAVVIGFFLTLGIGLAKKYM